MISHTTARRELFPREAMLTVVLRAFDRRQLLAAAMATGPAILAARFSSAFAQESPPAAGAATLGWSDELVDDNGKLNVVTTVAPISSIARNVGGDRIDLHGVIPDGTNSHTFEPAPSDAKILSQADVIFVNGLDLELPTMDLAEANLRDGAEIVTLGEQTMTRRRVGLRLLLPARRTVIPIRTSGRTRPTPSATPRSSPTRLRDAIPPMRTTTRRTWRATAPRSTRSTRPSPPRWRRCPQQNRKLLTYHDSWAYFAPRYGFVVIGAAQPSDFSEPSPQEVAALIDQIKAEQVPAVFGSEVFASVGAGADRAGGGRDLRRPAA